MKCYFDLPEELVEQLQKIEDETIEKKLRELSEERSNESDELAAYDSISDIRNDESKSPEERKRLELKAQRRDGFRKH